MRACATAPGKTILLGEHFVVYGEPAIVAAIDRRAKVTAEELPGTAIHVASDLGIFGTFEGEVFNTSSGQEGVRNTLEPAKIAAQSVLNHSNLKRGVSLRIESEIPVAVGLGSSSAISVATVAAVGQLFDVSLSSEEIFSLSLDAERFVHGNPSGIDQRVSTFGGILLYRKGERTTEIRCPVDLPLVIINTGKNRNTGILVESVRSLRERHPAVMGQLTRAAGGLVDEGVAALSTGDLKAFGELMYINHGLLVSAGVSIEALDRLVYAAKASGALGAKLTGAGGGGCVVVLCEPGAQTEVAEGMKEAGGEPMIVEKTGTGVQTWLEE